MPPGRTRSWQRTAELYRSRGYEVHKTETTFRGRSHDLMGFADGIALGIGHTVYLQACGRDWQEHVRKMTGPCARHVVRTLMAGNAVHLVGWRKTGAKGRQTWNPRIAVFGLDPSLRLVYEEGS